MSLVPTWTPQSPLKSKLILVRTLKEATDTDNAYYFFFFGYCGAAGADRCGFKALPGDVHNYENLVKKFNAWVGADPSAPNRSPSDQQSPLTTDQAYQVRDMLFSALYSPSQYAQAAKILQYWYEQPQNIASSIDIPNYKFPTSGSTKKRQNQVSPNFNPASTFTAQRALTAIACLDTEYHPTADASFYQTLYSDYLGLSRYGGDIALSGAASCAPWLNRPSST